VIIQDINFDDLGINYVTNIEQIYDAECFGGCVTLSNFNFHPISCTKGIADVRLTTFDLLPTFDTEPRLATSIDEADGTIAVQMYPGDENVNFKFGEGSFLRLGGATSKTFGRLAIRVLDYASWDDRTISVTFRFHTECEEVVPSTPTFSGYLTATAEPVALINPIDVPQTRTGRLSVDSVIALLEVEDVSSVWLHSAGVVGRDLMTSASLYKINSNGIKTLLATVDPSESENIWNTPSITSENPVQLSRGDFLQWTCTYGSTDDTPLPPLPGSLSGPITSTGGLWSNFACDAVGVFTNSKCGGVQFSPDNVVPLACADPLWTPPVVTNPLTNRPLIYDYNKHGECSDGGQWNGSPQNCWKQFGSGECVYCVGRANNLESRTCINRNGAECNPMFNSLQGKSFCNMEFECPATTAVVFPVLFLFAALIALL